MIDRVELQPGSPEPSNPADVERVLAGVPELVFLPAFEPCIPARPPEPTPDDHAQLDTLADDTYRQRVSKTLLQVEREAQARDNGGLEFLARTMRHFLDQRPVPASQHPLLVGLYLRGEARAGRLEDAPSVVAAAMDRWV